MQEQIKRQLGQIIFMGRWFQLPLYFGLSVILLIYAWLFIRQLINLVAHATALNDIQIMLHVLDLIDVVMIANLLIMVIVGGYDTFVAPLRLGNHPDRPEWLDSVNAGSMKVKLALALVSISSIHLLRTFIDPSQQTDNAIHWQVMIHLTLVFSTLAIAAVNYFSERAKASLPSASAAPSVSK